MIVDMAETVGKVEAANARANRWLVRIAMAAVVILLGVGATTVVLQVRAIQHQEEENRDADNDREQLKSIAQELRECTTPADASSECQKRLAEGQRMQSRRESEDNLRASIAVGSCLREQAADVEACALARFRALAAASDAQRSHIKPTT